MKLALRSAVVLGLVVGVACVQADGLHGKEAKKLKAMYDRWGKAFAAHDLKGCMSIYAPDVFAYDVAPPREYTSRAAYQKSYEGFFKAFPGPIKVKYLDSDFTTVGDVGYAHAAEDFTLAMADKSTTHMILRVTDVFRKIKGKWLVVQEHVSVPVDMDTMKPDLESKS